MALIVKIGAFLRNWFQPEKWFYYRRHQSGCHFHLSLARHAISLLILLRRLLISRNDEESLLHIAYLSMMVRFCALCYRWWGAMEMETIIIVEQQRRNENFVWMEKRFLRDVFIYFSRSKRRVKFVFSRLRFVQSSGQMKSRACLCSLAALHRRRARCFSIANVVSNLYHIRRPNVSILGIHVKPLARWDIFRIPFG